MNIGPIQTVPPTQTNVDGDANARRLPFRSSEPKFSPSPAPPAEPPVLPAPVPQAAPAPQVPDHRISVNIDDAKQLYYQVIDQRTGEVVRQVPSEDVLRIGR